jgi:hydrogenase maturation protease
MTMLVAGIGNIFLSDDGFGPEVLTRFRGRSAPAGVEVADYGIRGVHLAYRLLDGIDTLVLVDAAPHGAAPGTVSLLEVDPAEIPAENVGAPPVDAHGMEPVAVLRLLRSLGGSVRRVLVVACEPKVVEEGMGLSPEVEAAVPAAVTLIEELLSEELRKVST